MIDSTHTRGPGEGVEGKGAPDGVKMSVKTSWRSVLFLLLLLQVHRISWEGGEGDGHKKEGKKSEIKSSTISVDIVTAIRLFLIRLNSFYLSCFFFILLNSHFNF